MKKYLAVDIGGTFIKYGLIQENATILETNKVKTPKTLEELLLVIEQISNRYRDVEGLAVSCPGAVSDSGFVYGTSALPYIHGPNLKELMKERSNMPVYMENDANCAGYAEVWAGNAKGKKDVIIIVIGTGIGGAIMKDGWLHKGANLHGGEFGYMLVNSDFNGNYDVWSAVASTNALIQKVAASKNVDPETLSGEAIFALAEAGDPDCVLAIDQFYQLLAVGIYNLQYMYDPEIILIGGGISAREDLIDKLNAKLNQLLTQLPASKIKPQINTCQFRQNANLLGATYGLIKRL